MSQPGQTAVATGSCLCGGVQYRVNGPLRAVTICHCRMCQRQHTHAGAYSACAPGDLEILPGATLAWFQSSSIARRGFCSRCGAGLFWDPAHGRHISLSAGTLDSTDLRFGGHIFTAKASPLYPLPLTETGA
jgi:hypothetical protein